MLKYKTTALLLIIAIMSAGCLSFVTGQEPARFKVESATISENTVAETGYQLTANETTQENRTIEVQDRSRKVIIESHSTQYVNNQTGLTRGVVSLRVIPGATVFGQPVNPLAHASNQQIINQLVASGNTLRNLQKQDNRTVTALGEEQTVTTFTANTDGPLGRTQNVTVHVTKIAHETDLIFFVGVHETGDSEQYEIMTELIRRITH